MLRKDKLQTRFISKNPEQEIRDLNQQPGKNILIFGSPSVVSFLMGHNLIDEHWLFVNPVILGKGIPVFTPIQEMISLEPLSTKVFACGVTALAYVAKAYSSKIPSKAYSGVVYWAAQNHLSS